VLKPKALLSYLASAGALRLVPTRSRFPGFGPIGGLAMTRFVTNWTCVPLSRE
jgi:hypothetical protein